MLTRGFELAEPPLFALGNHNDDGFLVHQRRKPVKLAAGPRVAFGEGTIITCSRVRREAYAS